MVDSIYHMTLKLLKNHIFGMILASFMQHYNRPLNVMHLSVNHLWFIDFIAWHYFTPKQDVM